MMKQVLILRHDLKVRKGKLIAQGAHAAVGAMREARLDWLTEWDATGSTKICVHVPDEKALLDLHIAAMGAKLPTYLVLDAGRTEFTEPTFTALAIGPAPAEQVDILTGALPLF